MLKQQIKSFVFAVLAIYVGLMLLAMLMSLGSHHYLYHYIGKTVITPEQYVELAVNNVSNDGQATLTQVDIGLSLKYDFYSSKSYDFLSFSDTKGFWDTPDVNTLRTAFSSTSGMVVASIVICIALLILGYRYQRRVLDSAMGLYRAFLRLKYRRLKGLSGGVVIDLINSFPQADCKGIIAVRSWRCSSKGVLTSLVHSVIWKKTALEADALPEKANFSGVYAYRLGAPATQQGEVMGLVEMRGRFWYHPDGVVRAESCNILCLFLHNASDKLSQHLSVKYGVPVCTANTSDEAYVSWLFSKQGLQGLQHNMELLGE